MKRTLYSRATTGKVLEWTIEVESNKYRTISGYIDGVKTTSEWTICEPKNVGRSNSTTAEEQAINESTAIHRKKMEKGAFENINDIDIPIYFEPMLANKWEDYKNKIVFPAYSQPKLDGCLSYDTLINTDKGKLMIGDIINNNIDCLVDTYNTNTNLIERKKILNRMKNGIDINEQQQTQWYEIEVEDGRKIKITGNHRVYLPKLRCWRRVDELNENDILLNYFKK
jgi:hypothetical protein